MAKKKLIIVESPTKARTIRKFLSKDYDVESCMGHLRDLPESVKEIPEKLKKYKWAKLGVNIDKNFEPIYCIPKSKEKVLSLLKKKSKTSKEVILATDEDREGESISWHLKELLKINKSQPVFKRMVFHEITKEAIQKSLDNFRNIDKNLVYAQEARRILDRLVGYSISPVLWKKVARGLSAGRVQSVAVRLLSERELKRMAFKSSIYWSISALLLKGKNEISAQLVSYKNQEIAGSSDFDRVTGQFKNTKKLLLDKKKAKTLMNNIQPLPFKVVDLKTQSISKKPSPPFTTSTLQQEGNRRLSLSSKETMSLAQQLYERGFITYMRTDSVFLSNQAVNAARSSIKKHFGKEYVPQKPRFYKSKTKGAQEAHEAIRPAGAVFIHPKDSKLSGHLLKLYQMIWQRTLASQTEDCQQKKVSIKIKAGELAVFSAGGLQIIFDGFYKIYGRNSSEFKEHQLPPLKVQDLLKCKKLLDKEHKTQPPARFTEASLVQTLEKEGIGRPSTYAPIIATIQKRGYVFKDKNMLIPTMTGLIVTRFLTDYFPDYVDTQFTSDMEEVLDEIAVGKKNHIKYLDQIYFGKNGLKKQVEIQEKQKNDKDSKSLKLKFIKGFTFFAGPWGAYAVKDSKTNKETVSVSLNSNIYPGDLTAESIHDLIDQKAKGHDSLGQDPKTKEPIYVLTGKYGPYVQRGDVGKDKKSVKRVSIPRKLDSKEVDLDMALKLLELPKVLGNHPETQKEVKKGIGRFGPYIVHDGDFRSVKDIQEFLQLSLKQALKILSEPKKGRGKTVLKELGPHPETGSAVQILDGKFGPYIQNGRQKVSLPNSIQPQNLTLKQALEFLNFKNNSAQKKSLKNGAKFTKIKSGSMTGVKRKKIVNKSVTKTIS